MKQLKKLVLAFWLAATTTISTGAAEQRGMYEVALKKTDYFVADKDGRSIPLPGRPYMAIPIRRVKE